MRGFERLWTTRPLAGAELKALCWRLATPAAGLIRDARQDVVRILDG